MPRSPLVLFQGSFLVPVNVRSHLPERLSEPPPFKGAQISIPTARSHPLSRELMAEFSHSLCESTPGLLREALTPNPLKPVEIQSLGAKPV